MSRYAFVKDAPDGWWAVIVDVEEGSTTGDVVDFARKPTKLEIDAYVAAKLAGERATVYEHPPATH